MRIWPLTTFRARWRASRNARVLAAAEAAQDRERNDARRRLLDNARGPDLVSPQDENRATGNGHTRMPNAGPFPIHGQQHSRRRRQWPGDRR